jgi:hypothetical protein
MKTVNPTPRPESDRFLVAFSFAGEQRELVRQIAEETEQRLGWGTVFFDEWFEGQLAGTARDLKLQQIYRTCEVIVVCASADYRGKKMADRRVGQYPRAPLEPARGKKQ